MGNWPIRYTDDITKSHQGLFPNKRSTKSEVYII